MPTRRTFLRALASLAAAAGLSRLAGGAEATAPAKPAPAPEGLTFTRTAVVTGLEAPPPVPQLGDKFSGVLRVRANTSVRRNGKWQPSPWRIMRYERGRLVEVSPELPEAP